MTGTIVAQLFVVLTLVLMIIGKTPMYVTAVVGSTLAALFAGIPLFGSAPVTIKSLLISKSRLNRYGRYFAVHWNYAVHRLFACHHRRHYSSW